MNNYNFYFSNPSNKPSKSSKLGDRSPRPQITVQPCQRSLNNTQWTSITDSQEKLILNNLASNNYFKYTASKEEPNNNNNNNNLGYKHNLSSELILARSMTYDFKFKTDFVDSKLNLATALGKSGESLDKRSVNREMKTCIFIYFILHYFTSYKIARISVNIRHLFIETECLLIGCVVYIS